MNIDDLTMKQVREIASMVPKAKNAQSDFAVGETVLIRTVTMYWVGTVTKVSTRFLSLEPAAWIADTGRFADAVSKGVLNEIEPVPSVRVAVGAIVDVVPWAHAVPRTQK